MTASLELLAKRAHVAPGRIEHENRRMVLQVLCPLMDDIDQSCGVHGHVMCSLPMELSRKLSPLVLDLVTMFALTDHQRLVGLASREYRGRCQPGGGGGRCGRHELTSVNLCWGCHAKVLAC